MHNACRSITPAGPGVYDEHIGIDVHMSPQHAQAILGGAGPAFYAKNIPDRTCVWRAA